MVLTPKQARRLKDLTTVEVAKQMGISRWTYEKLEKNPERFTIAQARKFCEVTSTSHEQVFFAQTSN